MTSLISDETVCFKDRSKKRKRNENKRKETKRPRLPVTRRSFDEKAKYIYIVRYKAKKPNYQ